jgi:hypothetical protein
VPVHEGAHPLALKVPSSNTVGNLLTLMQKHHTGNSVFFERWQK